MKVSVITACLNNQDTIREAMNSLVSQTYSDIEHLVQDGLSSDDTLKIISSVRPESILITEKDDGMYDALNRGIARSGGDIIGLLHSDDFFLYPDVISDVVELFQRDECDAVYGDLVYVDRRQPGKIVRKWKSGKYRKEAFLRGWMPPHPTFFVKRSVVKKFGSYNTVLKSAADYEWLLRLIYKHGIKISYLPKELVAMRTGGKSNKSISARLKANREDRKAWRINDISPKWYTMLLKPLRKLPQFLYLP